MFHILQDKIKEARFAGDPSVKLLLALLSKAIKAKYQGNDEKAQYYVDIAMRKDF